nr:MAG TPA: hypothetical protein [Bacteriophage sp.]
MQDSHLLLMLEVRLHLKPWQPVLLLVRLDMLITLQLVVIHLVVQLVVWWQVLLLVVHVLQLLYREQVGTDELLSRLVNLIIVLKTQVQRWKHLHFLRLYLETWVPLLVNSITPQEVLLTEPQTQVKLLICPVPVVETHIPVGMPELLVITSPIPMEEVQVKMECLNKLGENKRCLNKMKVPFLV